MPKISVVMPAYNAEKYIGEAIGSILGQSFRDFEFIIINDCSKDATEDIILSYADERIVYVKNEENLGVARTLNKGLEIARGEYIARMDADDVSMPGRLEKQAAFLDRHPNVAVLGSAVERFCDEKSLGLRLFSRDGRLMNIDLLFACGLAHPSVMLRAEPVRDLGGYDADYEGLEDYELWWRLSHRREIVTLPDTLLRYRVHEKQVTKNPSERYLTRLRSLKKRQLEALGLPAEGTLAESYYRFCEGERPKDYEGVCSLCGFLESVIDANRGTGSFDARLLEDYFRSIAVNAAAGLKGADAWQVCRKSRLVGALPLAKRKLQCLVQ